MATEFKLPELGENIEAGDLVRLMVAPGAEVSEGQPVMELETDKAVIEVPSSVSGVIKDIRVKEGEKIKVGQTVFTVENGASSKAPAPPKKEDQPAQHANDQDEARIEVQTEIRDEGKAQKEALPPDHPLPQVPPKEAGTPMNPPAGGASEFKLPELGENISEGDLVHMMVKPGDKVSEGQPVMELETDKAVVEVPSDVTGIVKDVRAKEGEKVKVGQVIFTLEGGAPAAPPKPEKPQPVEHLSGQQAARVAFQAAIKAEGKQEHEALPPDRMQEAPPSFELPAQLEKTAGPEHREPIPAAPHVRRLAREIGVDIYSVKGSGPGGRITQDDVKTFAKQTIAAIPQIAAEKAAQAPSGYPPVPQLPDFGKWGKTERVPIRGIRRKTAEHLWQAWLSIPHVTQHDKADITNLEQLRARFAPRAEQAGGKMTVTAIALKVCASALKVFPQFNSTIDIKNEDIVYKQYVNIGVAVDTDRGLLVPVIRDVDKKNITELAVELTQLGKKARDKKLTPEDMEGGTFTITNLGGLGGTAFTPIVNHPEVAILGMSRSHMEPAYINNQFEPRLMLPLSLSYDHRLIDGADAVRFLRWIVEALEQPFLLSVQG